MHSTFCSDISENLLPKQFLQPLIFLLQQLFSQSNALLHEHYLSLYRFPLFPSVPFVRAIYLFFFQNLTSFPISSLISVSHVLACPRMPLTKHYPTLNVIPVSTSTAGNVFSSFPFYSPIVDWRIRLSVNEHMVALTWTQTWWWKLEAVYLWWRRSSHSIEESISSIKRRDDFFNLHI